MDEVNVAALRNKDGVFATELENGNSLAISNAPVTRLLRFQQDD